MADLPDVHTLSFEQLGEEFRSLRKIKGHFEGGNFTESVDSYSGRKHQVMQELANRFASGPFEPQEHGLDIAPSTTNVGKVIDLLENPDLIVQEPLDVPLNRTPSPFLLGHPASTSVQAQEMRAASGEMTMVYFWRGKHDFLFFKVGSDNQSVRQVGWYKAGE